MSIIEASTTQFEAPISLSARLEGTVSPHSDDLRGDLLHRGVSAWRTTSSAANQRYLTMQEAVAYTGCSRQILMDAIDRGDLMVGRVPGDRSQYKFRTMWLDNWMASHGHALGQRADENERAQRRESRATNREITFDDLRARFEREPLDD